MPFHRYGFRCVVALALVHVFALAAPCSVLAQVESETTRKEAGPLIVDPPKTETSPEPPATNNNSGKAKPSPALNRVTALAMDKELELMEMSTNLKIQTAPLNQWRERRWFSYTFSNQVLTIIGVLMNGCTRFRYRFDAARAPKNIFVNSSWLRVIGYCIVLAGCAGEAANDLRMQIHEKKTGVDLKSYLKYARENLAAIDDLIRQRSALLDAETDSENREMLIREGIILARIRNCCADDLEEAYIRAKSVRTSRYFQYGYVGTSSILGGAGTLANTISTMENRPPQFLWPAGVGDTTTGWMNAFAPEAVRAAGDRAGRKAGHPLTTELTTFDAKDEIINKFDADLQKFVQLPACQSNSEISGHVPFYKLQGEILAQHFSMRPVAPKGTLVRVSGDAGAFAGGSTKSVNGILTLVGAYKYRTNSVKRAECFGAGGVTYGAGMSFAAEEVLRHEIESEYHWFKQPKERRLKGVLKAQLAALTKAREDLHAN